MTLNEQALQKLEDEFALYPEHEQQEIAAVRIVVRNLINKWGPAAKVAIVAMSLEVGIEHEKQKEQNEHVPPEQNGTRSIH